MNRPADKAGSWYSGDAKGLRAEVGDCVRAARERYGRTLSGGVGSPVGVVVPHAGLAYSGVLAGLGFELVRERVGAVDVFVIFGACHRERLRRPAVWGSGEWETPLGPVLVDEGLASALVEAGVGELNERPHFGDNAIELQMPFVKALFPEALVVPVAMGSFADSWRYGEAAARVVRARGGKAVAIGSTDLTHYGASFGVTPAGVGETALAWTRENDGRFLDALTGMELDKIVSVANRDGSACGAGAAAAVAGWAKGWGCEKGRLLARTDSHEVYPRGVAEHFVGYGAVAFEV